MKGNKLAEPLLVSVNGWLMPTHFHGHVVAEWPSCHNSVYLWVNEPSLPLQEFLKHMSMWSGPSKQETLANLSDPHRRSQHAPDEEVVVNAWEISNRQLPAVRMFLARTRSYRPPDCETTVKLYHEGT